MRIRAFDFSTDVLRALLWQYTKAERLQAIMRAKQEWYDANLTVFWDDWYRDVFDLRTANDFGLNVWARILGVPLFSRSEGSEQDAPCFGFGSEISIPNAYQNFENGNFLAKFSSDITLTTEQRRLILQLRYMQLISRGTVPVINRILQRFVGNAYILDTYDMNFIVVMLDQDIPSDVIFILQQFDLLPRPAGVGILFRFIRNDLFGFAPYYQNFENGVFANG